jgi:hypothetical protein
VAKPTPKKEMLVIVSPSALWIEVYPASMDAEEWLLKEVPPYGRLFKESNEGAAVPYYRLFPSSAFDVEDVIKYIENMG